MPTKFNAASRLLELLQQTAPYQDGTGCFAAWCVLFKIEGPDTNKNDISITNKLSLVYREVQTIKVHLVQSQFSDGVFTPTLSKIESAISPQILHAQWASAKQYLTQDVYTSLGYCVEILPSEEISISAEDFAAIVSLINELELLLQDAALPDHLVGLIRHHIELIELAISNYPITGAQGLRVASKQALGDVVESAEEITANQGLPAVKAFGELWRKVNTVADTAIKADKLAHLGAKAMKLLEQFI